MRVLNPFNPADIPGRKKRVIVISNSNHGHVIRSRKGRHQPRKATPPSMLTGFGGQTHGKWRRSWLSLFARTWREDTTGEIRPFWATYAGSMEYLNYKNAYALPKGFYAFIWYECRCLEMRMANFIPFPSNKDMVPWQYDPPWDPPTLEAPEIISALPNGFVTVRCLNKTPAGQAVEPISMISLYPPVKGTKPTKRRPWYFYASSVTGDHTDYFYDLSHVTKRLSSGTRAVLLHCYGSPFQPDAGDTGPTSPTIGADADAGDSTWSDPMNICYYDPTTADCTIDGSLGQTNSNKIQGKAIAWEPPIPDTAEVLGIKAQVMRQEISQGGGLHDLSVRLMKAGAEVGDNKGTQPWGNDQAFPYPYKTYGGETDLWGETWTGADLNDPGFGLSLSCHRTGEHNTDHAVINHAKVTAWYVPLPTGWFTELTQTNFVFI
jgi:hypothetical protein